MFSRHKHYFNVIMFFNSFFLTVWCMHFRIFFLLYLCISFTFKMVKDIFKQDIIFWRVNLFIFIIRKSWIQVKNCYIIRHFLNFCNSIGWSWTANQRSYWLLRIWNSAILLADHDLQIRDPVGCKGFETLQSYWLFKNLNMLHLILLTPF